MPLRAIRLAPPDPPWQKQRNQRPPRPLEAGAAGALQAAARKRNIVTRKRQAAETPPGGRGFFDRLKEAAICRFFFCRAPAANAAYASDASASALVLCTVPKGCWGGA